VEHYDFLSQAADLSNTSALRLLVEKGIEPLAVLSFFRCFEGLPPAIVSGGLHLGVEQTAARLREEQAEVMAWTDAKAEEELQRRRVARKEFEAEESGRRVQRITVTNNVLDLLLAWRPQFEDTDVQKRAEILRARLISRLVDTQKWAERVSHDIMKPNSPLPRTGADYRDAEVLRLESAISAAVARTLELYAEFKAELPVLLDLRRFLDESDSSQD